MSAASTGEPGAKWRILAHRKDSKLELENEGRFEELVLDNWLHIEKMDDNTWWLRIGDARVMVTVSLSGSPSVDIERGFYEAIDGITLLERDKSQT